MSSCKPLDLEKYRSLIQLDEIFEVQYPDSETEIDRINIITDLLACLEPKAIKIPPYDTPRKNLYAQLTLRKPNPFPSWFLEKMNRLLQYELSERNLTHYVNLNSIKENFSHTEYRSAENCALWIGDITNLSIDAIVNAANSGLLGCFRPFHKCVDNAIHAAAGPQLRDDCNTIINKQRCPEGTGWAKITRAYNLPSKYILHTVGPIIDNFRDSVSYKNEEKLAACYVSCLELASRVPSIHSIAFCSISTGVFSYPKEQAAQIALRTVDKWLKDHPKAFELIVFNVFTEDDYKIYEHLLKTWKR